ncbi:hypothetical protein L0152_00500 [bacterium]|nr:hypothetical protein [bacterium]
MNPEVEGAHSVAWFRGYMTIGCAVGLVLLKLFDSRWLLVGATAQVIEPSELQDVPLLGVAALHLDALEKKPK